MQVVFLPGRAQERGAVAIIMVAVLSFTALLFLGLAELGFGLLHTQELQNAADATAMANGYDTLQMPWPTYSLQGVKAAQCIATNALSSDSGTNTLNDTSVVVGIPSASSSANTNGTAAKVGQALLAVTQVAGKHFAVTSGLLPTLPGVENANAYVSVSEYTWRNVRPVPLRWVFLLDFSSSMTVPFGQPGASAPTSFGAVQQAAVDLINDIDNSPYKGLIDFGFLPFAGAGNAAAALAKAQWPLDCKVASNASATQIQAHAQSTQAAIQGLSKPIGNETDIAWALNTAVQQVPRNINSPTCGDITFWVISDGAPDSLNGVNYKTNPATAEQGALTAAMAAASVTNNGPRTLRPIYIDHSLYNNQATQNATDQAFMKSIACSGTSSGVSCNQSILSFSDLPTLNATLGSVSVLAPQIHCRGDGFAPRLNTWLQDPKLVGTPMTAFWVLGSRGTTQENLAVRRGTPYNLDTLPVGVAAGSGSFYYDISNQDILTDATICNGFVNARAQAQIFQLRLRWGIPVLWPG